MSATLTPRGTALHRAYKTRGISEQPPGSNSDHRQDGIHAWQRSCANGATFLDGAPWCGVRCFDLLKHAGVHGISSRLASVELIEEDARGKRHPFRDWAEPTQINRVLRGDLVVLFGRGVHVGMVREIKRKNGVWVVITEEGNTTPPAGSGDQANGGCTARRERLLSDVHGFALVDYPG